MKRPFSHHFEIVGGRLERVSMPFRYARPSELDVMAELAGISLRERWSGWRRGAVHERQPQLHLGLGEAPQTRRTARQARSVLSRA